MEVKGETYFLRSLKNDFSIPMKFLMKKARKKTFLMFCWKNYKHNSMVNSFWRGMFSKFEVWKDQAKLT